MAADALTEAAIEAIGERLKAGHRERIELGCTGKVLWLYWEVLSRYDPKIDNWPFFEGQFVVEMWGSGGGIPQLKRTYDTPAAALAVFDSTLREHAVEIAVRALGVRE